MKLHQLSLFLENKPGQVIEPCRLLAREGINIRTLALADTEQFGILRLVVSDWERARQVLQDAGYIANVTEVVAVEVSDSPGGLARILETLENSAINIEYMYAFAFGRNERAVLIFRFDKPDEGIDLLQGAGINVVNGVELAGHIGV